MPNPTTGSAPAFLNDAPRAAPSADRLTEIKNKVAELRDLTLEIQTLEERLEQVKGSKLVLETTTLPDMMQAAGMNSFGLEAEGNNPAYDANIEPLIRANIAAGWEEPKRQAGFQVLEALGGQSLIKTVVTFEFGGSERAAAKEFAERVFDEHGYEGNEALSVNHNTLASWLKSEVTAKPEPRVPSPAQLLAIGGFVGRTVKIKKRKET
jgi:hypothetical protein